MFFIVFGHHRRSAPLGTVGPFTCPRCHWIGRFWLVAYEQRFHLYGIPFSKRWKPAHHSTVCGHCLLETVPLYSAVPALLEDLVPFAPSDAIDGPTEYPAAS
jgi:hypothetical protein